MIAVGPMRNNSNIEPGQPPKNADYAFKLDQNKTTEQKVGSIMGPNKIAHELQVKKSNITVSGRNMKLLSLAAKGVINHQDSIINLMKSLKLELEKKSQDIQTACGEMAKGFKADIEHLQSKLTLDKNRFGKLKKAYEANDDRLSSLNKSQLVLQDEIQVISKTISTKSQEYKIQEKERLLIFEELKRLDSEFKSKIQGLNDKIFKLKQENVVQVTNLNIKEQDLIGAKSHIGHLEDEIEMLSKQNSSPALIMDDIRHATALLSQKYNELVLQVKELLNYHLSYQHFEQLKRGSVEVWQTQEAEMIEKEHNVWTIVKQQCDDLTVEAISELITERRKLYLELFHILSLSDAGTSVEKNEYVKEEQKLSESDSDDIYAAPSKGHRLTSQAPNDFGTVTSHSTLFTNRSSSLALTRASSTTSLVTDTYSKAT